MDKNEETHTREEFFAEARKLGITPEMAVDILRRNGIKGKYDASRHLQYVKLLNDHVKSLKRIMRVVNKTEDKYHPLEKCPICGHPVERDSERDGSLGEPYAWKCTNPEQGLGTHFFQHRLERIRPWLMRNRDTSEQGVNLGKMSLTEYLSGESQMESSSVDSSE